MKLYHERARQLVELINVDSPTVFANSEQETIIKMAEELQAEEARLDAEALLAETKAEFLKADIIEVSKVKRGRPKKAKPYDESAFLAVFQPEVKIFPASN
jgi:hypothetical protein